MNKHDNSRSVIDILNDPFGVPFVDVKNILGENAAKAWYTFLYKNNSPQKAHTIWAKEVLKNADTQKYVFELLDGKYIETVCIRRKTGVTACVSTQVGCPVQCVFCQSGRNGFGRNLSPSEIVQQVLFLKEKINRIVFMGIGEPLYNYDALIRAIHILRDRNGMDFPTDGITISTVGPIKQLKKLREEHIKIQLTLSLHATTQQTRDYIIPGMSGNDINQTVEAALSYSHRHNRKIVIGYLLLPGMNDKYSDVKRLADWFKHENAMINLMEYNPTGQKSIRAPKKNELEQFKNKLENKGLEVKIRESRGGRINAACGQLISKHNTGRR